MQVLDIPGFLQERVLRILLGWDYTGFLTKIPFLQHGSEIHGQTAAVYKKHVSILTQSKASEQRK